MLIKMLYYIGKYPFSLAMMATVTYLSLMNPPSVEMLPFSGWDKVVHFGMYGGVSGIIWLECLFSQRRKAKPDPRRGFVFAGLCPAVMGGMLEIGQCVWTENRSGDWMDFVANTGGVVVASLIAWFVLRPRIVVKTRKV